MSDYYTYHQQIVRQRRRRRIVILLLTVLVLLSIAVGALYFLTGEEDEEPLPAMEPVAESTELTAEPTAEPAPAAPAGYAPHRILPQVDTAVWDTAVPVEQTIDFEYLNTDFRMAALPMLGTVDRSYFNTVTFVGESVMSGLGIYSTGLTNAHYVAYVGKNVTNFVDNTADMKNAVTGALESPQEALVATQPDYVYIMCGHNSLVYPGGETDFIDYYGYMIDKFRELLPGVTFYIQAISGVRDYTSQSESRPGLYAERINTVNNMLANLALSKGCYFVNIQEALCDPDSNMLEEYDANYDGVHMNERGYAAWREYLCTHTAWDPRSVYVGQSPYYIYGK